MSVCKLCQSNFIITQKDKEFLKLLSPKIGDNSFEIPLPSLCPSCRLQRRSIWRGELNLFKRKSDFSGKDIVTFFPPESKCKVYKDDEYWSDDWDELAYGKDFDFSKPFFEQFAELIENVPLLALSGFLNENSDYINCASWNKNCYLIAGANHNEDCYYSNYINNSVTTQDCNFVTKCELCYECVDCTDCYNLKYSFNSHTCSDSYFLHNCHGCSDCIGSVNLNNKKYYFFNEQLTKDEYQRRINELKLETRSGVNTVKEKFEQHRLKYPYKYRIGELNQDVTGHGINSSKNSFYCFDVSNLEDCSYCAWLHQSKNCMDVFAWGFPSELCYECMEAGDQSYSVLFNVSSYGSQNVMYSYYPMHSKDCFGCVSVRKKQYCILNKQYTKSEYQKLATQIIEHMQETGEWGEFFPMRLSPLAYNTAVTQDYFPMDKEFILSLGAKWHDYQEEHPISTNYQIPDSIDDVESDICKQVLSCRDTGKLYKIIAPEFKFYKANKIPIPDLCFNIRHSRRLKVRNPRQLWDRTCAKCSSKISTSYPPFKPETVYCESCYLEEVY